MGREFEAKQIYERVKHNRTYEEWETDWRRRSNRVRWDQGPHDNRGGKRGSKKSEVARGDVCFGTEREVIGERRDKRGDPVEEYRVSMSSEGRVSIYRRKMRDGYDNKGER